MCIVLLGNVVHKLFRQFEEDVFRVVVYLQNLVCVLFLDLRRFRLCKLDLFFRLCRIRPFFVPHRAEVEHQDSCKTSRNLASFERFC